MLIFTLNLQEVVRLARYSSDKEAYVAYVKRYGEIDEDIFNEISEKLMLYGRGVYGEEDLADIDKELSRTYPDQPERFRLLPFGRQWFRFSSYEILPCSDPNLEGLIIPAPGAKLTLYDLEPELDDIVETLCRCPVKVNTKWTSEHLPPFLIPASKPQHTIDFCLEFAKQFGLLGRGLRGVTGIQMDLKSGGLSAVHVRYGLVPVDSLLQTYLLNPVEKDCLSSHTFEPFWRAYMEDFERFVAEAAYFRNWVVEFKEAAEAGISNLDHPTLKVVNEILGRSLPGLSLVNGEKMTWAVKVNRLLDAAYLHVVDRESNKRSFRVCRNSTCAKVFVPRDPRQKFCCKKCQNTADVRTWREKNSGQLSTQA